MRIYKFKTIFSNFETFKTLGPPKVLRRVPFHSNRAAYTKALSVYITIQEYDLLIRKSLYFQAQNAMKKGASAMIFDVTDIKAEKVKKQVTSQIFL